MHVRIEEIPCRNTGHVPAICKRLLRFDEQDAPVIDKHTTIEVAGTMQNWHAEVEEDVLTVLMVDDSAERAPGGFVEIQLEEMVLAAIT